MTLHDIRSRYLEFYKKRGHVVIPSASLVPENDPTTLFTGSGMQPLLPYLLGEEHPSGRRLADSQKSFRAEDIEEVGDNRHTTFFEMLGNWSLGDYFKKEQLPWFFEFLTDEVGLDPRRLYVSVYAGNAKASIEKDDEAVAIWKELFAGKGIDAKDVVMGTEEEAAQKGMDGGRIFYYGKKNWWSRSGAPENMPAGEPGGPDSEVFFEFEDIAHDTRFGENCHPNCDCGRFMEVGNSVFMEYRKTAEGGFEKLSQRNVDFGGGLERIAAASEGVNDVFRVGALADIVRDLEDIFGATYGDKTDSWYASTQDAHMLSTRRAFRIITDHIRAAVFMICDGVIPSNKERGYILRRLVRRAALAGYKINPALEPSWVADIARAVISQWGGYWEALKEKEMPICEEILRESRKFYGTLTSGLKIFDSYAKENEATKTIPGSAAFLLFTTYGFPLELTQEKAAEIGYTVDEAAYKEEFARHQETSRTATAGVFKGGLADAGEKTTRLHTATHLMNAALRKVLGENVWQKGSNITPERTRFDFTHSAKMTEEEKKKVEDLVNAWVDRDLSVKKEIMPLEEARALGAIGVFGEKYPDVVSVYSVVDAATGEVISREFCGGPHVTHTGEIGKFSIQKEEASSAGIRRIKANVE